MAGQSYGDIVLERVNGANFFDIMQTSLITYWGTSHQVLRVTNNLTHVSWDFKCKHFPHSCMPPELWSTGQTRWYPWGTQLLVSTYSNCHWSLGEGGYSGKGRIWTQGKNGVWKLGGGIFWEWSDLDSGKKLEFKNFFGGGRGLCSAKSKLKVPRSGQI